MQNYEALLDAEFGFMTPREKWEWIKELKDDSIRYHSIHVGFKTLLAGLEATPDTVQLLHLRTTLSANKSVYIDAMAPKILEYDAR